jgi:hypothetical protein
VRIASAGRDGPDVHVTKVDVPAVLAFGVASAGEGGHGLLKRSRTGIGKRYRLRHREEGAALHARNAVYRPCTKD